MKKRATKRYTGDAAAYQLYLQGRYHWNKGTIAGYKKSAASFLTTLVPVIEKMRSRSDAVSNN